LGNLTEKRKINTDGWIRSGGLKQLFAAQSVWFCLDHTLSQTSFQSWWGPSGLTCSKRWVQTLD
jgi:hypothetical protein